MQITESSECLLECLAVVGVDREPAERRLEAGGRRPCRSVGRAPRELRDKSVELAGVPEQPLREPEFAREERCLIIGLDRQGALGEKALSSSPLKTSSKRAIDRDLLLRGARP
jgi:hypothetical protein